MESMLRKEQRPFQYVHHGQKEIKIMPFDWTESASNQPFPQNLQHPR
jgi:hypothetical protein